MRVGKRPREGLSIRQLGVLLSEDELRFISHLLINLKADDLIMEDARCDALAWITRVQQDIASARQDRPRSSVSQGAQGSQKWPAGDTRRPFHLEGKWLVDALVAGTVKSVGSSFGIGLGASPPVPMLMVLISWPTSEVSLAQRIWAQLSLDSWVRLAGCSRWGGSCQPLSRRCHRLPHRRME